MKRKYQKVYFYRIIAIQLQLLSAPQLNLYTLLKTSWASLLLVICDPWLRAANKALRSPALVSTADGGGSPLGGGGGGGAGHPAGGGGGGAGAADAEATGP